MPTAIDYFLREIAAKGISHSDVARAAWGARGSNAAINHWKRLRGVAGTKQQDLRYEDIKALCLALGLDPVRAVIEIEKLEK